jgi:agmatinase
MYKRDVQVGWAATLTFMRSPMRKIEELVPDSIAILGVPTDATKGSRPGTRFGPRAIRTSSGYFAYHLNSSARAELIDVESGRTYRRKGDPLVFDVGDSVLFPTDVEKSRQSVAADVAGIVERKAFPVILGGDHYISLPGVQGLIAGMNRRGEKPKIGFIHVDAHLDAKDENAIMGRHCNSTQVRRIAELPEVDPKNMVLVGLKEMSSRDQWDFIRESGINTFSSTDVHKQGAYEVTRKALEIAEKGTTAIYVSLDIDVVDNAFVPGTGAIVLDGITSLQFLEIARGLGDASIAALDLVEVAPAYDPGEYTQRLAASAVFYTIAPRILDVSTPASDF